MSFDFFSSLPGLTRQSIFLKKMDARVRPTPVRFDFGGRSA
jgi:hypothetical protein